MKHNAGAITQETQFSKTPPSRSVYPGGLCGLDTLEVCRTGQSMFRPPNCHIPSFETVV